jgi:cytochrome c1
VPNPNANPAELVPDLIHVARGYTNEELKDRILKGQREIPILDPNRPPPPLYMPSWRGRISDAEVDDLVAYLVRLNPSEEKSDF